MASPASIACFLSFHQVVYPPLSSPHLSCVEHPTQPYGAKKGKFLFHLNKNWLLFCWISRYQLFGRCKLRNTLIVMLIIKRHDDLFFSRNLFHSLLINGKHIFLIAEASVTQSIYSIIEYKNTHCVKWNAMSKGDANCFIWKKSILNWIELNSIHAALI